MLRIVVYRREFTTALFARKAFRVVKVFPFTEEGFTTCQVYV